MPDFDDRDGLIWMDGQMRAWRKANLHVLTHSLHYGSAVFEGERAYSGTVFRLHDHSKRLIESARLAGYQIPWSAEEIDQATKDVLEAEGHDDAYIRPIAWRGSTEMGLAARRNTIHLAIACWEWPSYFSYEQRMKGLKLAWANWRRPSPETAPVHSKMGGLYAICTMAKHAAEDQGFDDALFLDYRGLVAEATGANVFFVIDGDLHTPKPDCFLDGLTRQSVIELAREAGLEVIERHIEPAELERASEAFLTGTAAEVTPIRQIGSHHFTPGNLSLSLINAYDKLVRS
ncbi:MAG: branched-chain amino acid aminotransferase [Pseudomonadota bacterium]